jgi:hypothetical protein
MTYEEMLALAEEIKSALSKELRTNPEILEHKEGDAIPIAFDHEGVEFLLELNVL